MTCGEGYSLLSPPGKMERRRTFLFFSSGAIGSGLEAWFNDEESRELLFILKGGAGGFSSISTLSDIFSSTHKVLWERGRSEQRLKVRESLCRSKAGDNISLDAPLNNLEIWVVIQRYKCVKHLFKWHIVEMAVPIMKPTFFGGK